MGWMLLGAFLILMLVLGWTLAAIGATDDDRAVDEYERQRAAFERLFK